MDLEEHREFLEGYDGEEINDAHIAYKALMAEVEADFQVADQVGPHDAAIVRTHIADMLDVAERIGYRYQGIARVPIENGAIFIEKLDHYDYVLIPNGAVANRNDWRDREGECVRGFLFAKYPLLEYALGDI